MKFTFPPESRPLAGFTLKRAIYRGGFGEVYYGLSDAGREVALKLLQHNTDIELRGIQQCLNLSHPNLVTIFDVRTDEDGDHWVIMEYVAGETLESMIHRYPDGMPVELVRKWLAGMTAGIGFLHQRRVVHRDLKPANLFLQDDVVKIGDVGLSKLMSPSRRSAQTQSVGTVYYMAPEIARGHYSQTVDIYATGVILYEMLTGTLPFEGESTGEILMKHLTEKPDLSQLPARVRPVVARAMEKDPERRYAQALELLTDFEAALVGHPMKPFFARKHGAESLMVPPLPKRNATEKSPQSGLKEKGNRFSRKNSSEKSLISRKARRTSLGRSMRAASLSVPFVAALSGVLMGLRPSLFSIPGAEKVDPAMCGFFMAVAVISCWGILLTSDLHPEKRRPKSSPGTFALAGVCVGAIAWKLQQFLLIELPLLGDLQSRAVVHALGEQPLSLLLSGPTCLGYIVFFTTFFALRKWSRMTSPSRHQRFSIGAVLVTVLAAWLTTRIFDFPTAWALAWGAVIACSIQLASAWSAAPRPHAICHTKGEPL